MCKKLFVLQDNLISKNRKSGVPLVHSSLMKVGYRKGKN